MNILFIGDVFASVGRRAVTEHLERLIDEHQLQLVIANAENAAGGFGLTPAVVDELLSLPVDVLTTGNHVWDKKEILEYFPRQPRLLRPANYPGSAPGRGVFVGETNAGASFCIINLQGRTFMPNTDCPFQEADRILGALDPAVKIRVVDFHAEVTSEKVAMGWHLDGRVSAVIGTHTHIATADSRILPGGTAYQTDVGMTGPYDSVIGVEQAAALKRFLTGIPVRLDPAKKNVQLHGVLLEVDESSGKSTSIRRLSVNSDKV
jgi:metallophosphoesterase (TIGR00282 family)